MTRFGLFAVAVCFIAALFFAPQANAQCLTTASADLSRAWFGPYVACYENVENIFNFDIMAGNSLPMVQTILDINGDYQTRNFVADDYSVGTHQEVWWTVAGELKYHRVAIHPPSFFPSRNKIVNATYTVNYHADGP